jgi:aryl-alcohol dehydrogenase-like predicted oxidoreductase
MVSKCDKEWNPLKNMTFCQLGLGCWGLGGDAYGDLPEESSREILDLAQKEDIRFFDTSPSYGNGLSEFRLGSYIKDDKKRFIATKVGLQAHTGIEMPFDLSSNGIRESIQSSVARLRLETLPLVQVHSPPIDVLDSFPNLIKDLETMQNEGLVANWGVSLQKPQHVKFFSNLFSWSSYQVNFSLIDQRAMKEFEDILEQEIIIARTPLNFGFLTENFEYRKVIQDRQSHLSKWSGSQLLAWETASNQMLNIAREWGIKLQYLALRFILDSGFANVVIPGAVSATQLRDNLLALQIHPLENWQIIRIRETYERVEKVLAIDSPFRYKFNNV